MEIITIAKTLKLIYEKLTFLNSIKIVRNNKLKVALALSILLNMFLIHKIIQCRTDVFITNLNHKQEKVK